MPLQDQTISVNFGQGLDTKTDARSVVNGKMQSLQNAVFNKAKQLAKRNGYESFTMNISGGGTITAPMAVKSFNEELVIAGTAVGAAINGKRLFSYSPSENAWVDKGKYAPCKTSSRVLSSTVAEQSEVAEQGGYICSAWSASTSSTSQGHVTVIDSSNNEFIIPETKFGTTVDAVSLCALGTNSGFIVAWADGSPTIHLNFAIISQQGVVSAPIVTSVATPSAWRLVNTPTGAAILYTDGANHNVHLATINTSGSITATALLGSITSVHPYFLSWDGTNFWAYYASTSTTSLYYAVSNASLTPVVAQTVIDSSVSIDWPVVSSYSISGSSQNVCYVSGTSEISAVFTVATVTTSGTITSSITPVSHIWPLGEPVVISGTTYLPVIEQGSLGYGGLASTACLLDTTDFNMVGKAYAQNVVLNRGSPAGAWASRSFVIGETAYLSVNRQNSQTLAIDFGSPALSAFDFGSADLYQAQKIGQSLVWNGSIPMMYDGYPAVELGFIAYPTVSVSSTSATGGALANGAAYSYSVVFRWYDANGNLHQSQPSPQFDVTTPAGGPNTASVTLEISNLGLTYKCENNNRSPIQVGVFRTLANQTTFFLTDIGGATIYNIQEGAASYLYTDVYPDAAIAVNELLYTNGNVLPNTTPPCYTVACVRGNRLIVADDENPNTIAPSNSFLPGDGLSFTGFITEEMQETDGPITGLAQMDDKLIIGKQHTFYYSVGDFADLTGNNSTFSIPQLIPTNSGIAVNKSMIVYADGLMYKSDKGIYLLNRSLQDSYIGAPVEAYNGNDIQVATVLTDVTQVRLLSSSGIALVYDYFFQQWSTFTNHPGLGSDNWNNQYIYCRTDNTVYGEEQGYYLDNATPFSVSGQTAWIKFNNIQGYERLRNILLVGDSANGLSVSHSIQITPYYNYNVNSSSNPQKYNLLNPTSALYQFRYFPPFQKVQSISFVIQELTGTDQNETLTLSDMTLIVGVKKGAYKLPAAQSIG